MNLPDYTFDKIKFAIDKVTLEKAIALYEASKVTHVEEGVRSYRAIVRGTKPYSVCIEARRFDYGSCTCYVGINGTVCKHMVALAIDITKSGKPLTVEDKKIIHSPICSDQIGNVDNKKLISTQKLIAHALRYITSYSGPSRTRFAYQSSLAEGCRRLSAIVSTLPVGEQTTELLVKLLLSLDKKLSRGGVDDSDGTVGGFIDDLVTVLLQYAKRDPQCIKAFTILRNKETSFGWEDQLLILEKNKLK